jgi:hypothetical protein
VVVARQDKMGSKLCCVKWRLFTYSSMRSSLNQMTLRTAREESSEFSSPPKAINQNDKCVCVCVIKQRAILHSLESLQGPLCRAHWALNNSR